MTEEDKTFVGRCASELQTAIQDLGPEWSLELFGSAANGFGTKHSDIDATLVEDTSADKAADTQTSANILRDRVVPLLKEHPKFSVVEEVLGANIPILKLRFEDRLDVDLSCRNVDALQNTRLLAGYASLDERVRNLGVLVKVWARAAGVWGAARRHLSSYTFTLLAIYFMQVHPEVQLPYLPTGAFANRGDGQEKVDAARSLWKCTLSVSELFRRFFWFYHCEFEWGREVASVRLARRLWANDSLFEGLRGRWAPRLHVEDPYKLERNLHCVLGQDFEEMKLRVAFADAFRRLNAGGIPVGLDGSLLSTPGATLMTPPPPPQGLPMARATADRREAPEDSAGGSDSAEREVAAGIRSCRAASSLSSPDSAASTACGRSRLGESSGTEYLSSEDEKKDLEARSKESGGLGRPSRFGIGDRMPEKPFLQPFRWSDCVEEQPDEEAEAEDEREGGKATWQWWQHLNELPGRGSHRGQEPSEVAKKNKNKQPKKAKWHNIQDLEDVLGRGALVVGGPVAGMSFASLSTRTIASRVSRVCAEAGAVRRPTVPKPPAPPMIFQ